jgi:hypothetical protein
MSNFLPCRHALAGKLRIEPRAGIEALDLREREVRYRPRLLSALRLGAVRVDLLDVRRALECQVMQAHEHAVFRDLQILLDVVGALFERELVRRKRVFGRVRRRTPMRDQCLLRVLRLNGHAGRCQQ